MKPDVKSEGEGGPRAPTASSTPASPRPSSPHPTPSAMAREAYPDNRRDTPEEKAEAREWRIHYASGIAAERARIVAWLRAEAEERRACGTPGQRGGQGAVLWAQG